MGKPSKKITAIWTLLLILIFSTSITLLFQVFSSMPLSFLYLELGKIFGAFPKEYLTFGLATILVIALLILIYSLRTRGINTDPSVLLKNKKALRLIFIGLTISLLLLFFSSAKLLSEIEEQHEKMNVFVSEKMNMHLHDYINATEIFLNYNVNNSWDRPEAAFEIDNVLYATLLDSTILNSFGLTRADVILYQGWGSCGQEAFVIEELLHRADYTTRRAHFIGEGADHGWAEVNCNGSWFIVNPWWLGKWVEISNLRWEKPDFQNYTTVEVMYRNGTTLDLGKDYGYS